MSEPATGTQAVDRAAQLVATVVRADEPLAFAELAEECALPKSTAFRLLAALERTDLVERDGDGAYVAGPLFWKYAAKHDQWGELGRLAMPTLEALRDATGETANLGVARGDNVVHVAQADASFLLSPPDWTQVEVPPYASALGKALAAYGALAEWLEPYEQLTAATMTDPSTYARDLRNSRRRGYATTIDELEVGLTGVAAPVLIGDRVIAAIGISGPTPRLEERIRDLGALLTEHAEQLADTLGRRQRKEGVA